MLDEHLMQLMNIDGQEEFRQRLSKTVQRIASGVDAILLSQFLMATALSHLREIANVPLLSAVANHPLAVFQLEVSIGTPLVKVGQNCAMRPFGNGRPDHLVMRRFLPIVVVVLVTLDTLLGTDLSLIHI